MSENKPAPKDDVSSAPESGTIRDETSGSPSPDRGLSSSKKDAARSTQGKDDPSTAPEER